MTNPPLHKKLRLRWSHKQGWKIAKGRERLQPFNPRSMTYSDGTPLDPELADQAETAIYLRKLEQWLP